MSHVSSETLKEITQIVCDQVRQGMQQQIQEQFADVKQELRSIKEEIKEEIKDLRTGMEARIEELRDKTDRKMRAIEERVERLEMVDYDPQRTILFTDLPLVNNQSDAQLIATVLEEARLGDIKVRNVKRLEDSTMVQCELHTVEEKIKCLKEKVTIQDLCGSFVRSDKSHVEHINEQNFKTLWR